MSVKLVKINFMSFLYNRACCFYPANQSTKHIDTFHKVLLRYAFFKYPSSSNISIVHEVEVWTWTNV